ncbi:MAG: ribbon-helix-helix protein, CopG family [Akkermansiaceae bacterium]|nr:ribbon-helix-helix protein, CopG family [Akkermansiaceae bacterium]
MRTTVTLDSDVVRLLDDHARKAGKTSNKPLIMP